MNRILLLITLTFFGIEISAQNKIHFSINVSPTLSGSNYKLKDYSKGNSEFSSGKDYYDKFKHLYDSIESSGYGFQVSLNLNYLLTDKFSLMIGVCYNNIGSKYKIAPIIGSSSIGGITQYIYDYNKKQTLSSKFHYMGVPISLQSKIFSFGNYSIGINAGSTLNILLSHEGAELNSYPATSQVSKATSYSKIALNITGGINLSYSINNIWEVNITPQFVRYVTPNAKINLYSSNDLYFKAKQYNYYWGLSIGIKYKTQRLIYIP